MYCVHIDASHAAFVGVSFIEYSFIDVSHASLRGCFIHREHSFLDAFHAAFRDNNIKRDHRRNTVHENDSDSPLFMICVRGKIGMRLQRQLRAQRAKC